jgi:hypothetical protein
MGGMTMRRVAVSCGALLLGIGCRGDAAGEGPYARELAESMPRIEKSTGMRFKSVPKVEARSKEEVRAFLVRKFDEQTPARSLAGEEAAYKLLGMIPEAMNLRDFLLRVLGEQIVGYYDPAVKTLYIVKGADEQVLGITITHELVHALQDQYSNLDSIQKAVPDGDRGMAAQAVIEGQAQFEQLSIMTGGSDNIALRVGGRDRMRELIRENQSAMPVFATAPMVIQETLLFPYLTGADFVQRFKEQKGKANPLAAVPSSTEQLLHSPAYFGVPRDEPSTVTLPAPHGATRLHESDLGEFGTRLFLYQHLGEQGIASRAAAGWDGDRYMVVQGSGGRGIVWASVWDTPLEAAEFSDALVRATVRRTGSAERRLAEGGATFAAKGRTVSILPRTVGERALVIYSDLPDGMGTPIDAAAIKVTAR